MNLQKLTNNRFVIIILVAAILIGYTFFRGSRDRIEQKAEEKRPQYLTLEFSESQRSEATDSDRTTAAQLLEDAEIYMQSRDFRAAGSAYHRALAIFPDGKAYFEYALYLNAMKKTAWAMDSLDLAEKLGYNPSKVQYELAKIYADMKKPYEALNHLHSALQFGSFTKNEIESEKKFDIIRKSIITRDEYLVTIESLE